jgi:hypothetical protein
MENSFIFMEDHNITCMLCKKEKAYCWSHYYDGNKAYCKSCFYDKIKVISEKNNISLDMQDYWMNGYKTLYKQYDLEKRLNKSLQKSIDTLVLEKMSLQYDIDVLKRHLDFLQRQI